MQLRQKKAEEAIVEPKEKELQEEKSLNNTDEAKKENVVKEDSIASNN
jgi:hypothetical protein